VAMVVVDVVVVVRWLPRQWWSRALASPDRAHAEAATSSHHGVAVVAVDMIRWTKSGLCAPGRKL
jgi:hypothetical protein